MVYQISLNDEEYVILVAEAAERGGEKQPEEFLHDMIGLLELLFK